jgi:hypothetical protein
MTLPEIKKTLHEKIERINDVDFLKQILFKIDNRDKVFIIPEHMLESIKQGEEDIKNGDFITLEEFEKKYEKYLK